MYVYFKVFMRRNLTGVRSGPSYAGALSSAVRSTIVFTGSRVTGLIGLLSSLAAFLSLTKGYAAVGIHSSVSSGTESVMRLIPWA